MEYSFHLPAIGEIPLKFYHAHRKELLPKRVYPAHVHGGYELYILEEGESSFVVNGVRHSLCAGDAVFIRPGEIHNCVRERDGRHDHFCFHLGEEAEPFISRLSRFTEGMTLISLDEYGKSSLISLSRGCERAASAGDELLLFALFLRLLFFVGGESQKQKELPSLVEAIKAEMDTRFAESGLLSALEKQYFVSQSTLNRLSNRYLGVSPKKYIEKKRLSLATKLLREGASVKEAADAAGFADASTFIRFFRQNLGVTPLAYRRLCDEGAVLRQFEDIEV